MNRVQPVCPGCRQRPRRREQYLCRSCWFALPRATRRLLWIADAEARPRLRRLYQALLDGVAPNRITPGMIEADQPAAGSRQRAACN